MIIINLLLRINNMKVIITHPEKIEILRSKPENINYKKILICLILFIIYIIGCCYLLSKACLIF